MPRKRFPKGWKMLTTEQRVEALYLIIEEKMSQREVARRIGCTSSSICKLSKAYCNTVTVRTVSIKPEKKTMARLIVNFKNAPAEPRTEE